MTKRIYLIEASTGTAVADAPTFHDYEFNWLARYLLGEGVLDRAGTELKVTEYSGGANMSVDVAAGLALIEITNTNTDGTTYKVLFSSTAVENLAVTTADATNPRKDIVVARVDVSTNPDTSAGNVAILEVIAGTPAGSPTAPSVPANSILLATIDVPASDTTISNAQITDDRSYVTLDPTIMQDIERQGLTNSIGVAAGSDTVTITMTPPITAYSEDRLYMWVQASSNTGAMTLNIDGVGAKTLVKHGNLAMAGNDLRADMLGIAIYSSGDDEFKLAAAIGNPPPDVTKTVEAKTSDYTILSTDADKVLTNEGASAEIALTLPTAAAGIGIQFVCAEAQNFVIKCASGDFLQDNATQGDGIYAAAAHAALILMSINATDWVVIAKNGTWNVVYDAIYACGGFDGSDQQYVDRFKLSDESCAAAYNNLGATCGYAAGMGDNTNGWVGGDGTTLRKGSLASETWAANANALTETVNQCNAGASSATEGYIMAYGDSGFAKTAHAQNLVFATDAVSKLTSVMSTAAEQNSAIWDDTYAYTIGNGKDVNPPENTAIDKFTFSSETSAVHSDTLDNAVQSPAGANDGNTAGYSLGGEKQATVHDYVQKMTFSTGTVTTPGSTLNTSRGKDGGGQGGAGTKGYAFGGWQLSTYYDKIDDIDFSDDSSDQLAAVLTNDRYGVACVSGYMSQ